MSVFEQTIRGECSSSVFKFEDVCVGPLEMEAIRCGGGWTGRTWPS